MAASKNVIFVGMTQNGKSSLLQSVLRYCGYKEKADSVGIGDGNFAETQSCMFYEEIAAPLKTHQLRQLSGPMPDKDGLFVTPGEDFNLEDACDCDFEEVVSASEKSVQLTLIDTPGLSDSANDPDSSRGMGTVDERHKLRILFALQKLKEVHAICFVVRKGTNYGGDFKNLVVDMLKLLTFSVTSTAWNLSFHVIHTNIDVEDRAEDICRHRQQDFDAFGPPSARHHFIDNLPDEESPLEMFFHNTALSNLFQSFLDDPPVAFTDLRFPKSAEIENLDQDIINAIQRAINELQDHAEKLRETIKQAMDDIEQAKISSDLFRARVDRYEAKIKEYDSDSLTDIDGEENGTGTNVFGGGARSFSFKTTIPIADVVLSEGNWEDPVKETFNYSVRLQPSWLSSTTGSIKLKAKKKDKYADLLKDQRSQKAEVSEELQKADSKIATAEAGIAECQKEHSHITTSIEGLQRDLSTVRKSGRSILLSEKADKVVYLTLNTPISLALGYELQAYVPWSVTSLSHLNNDPLKERLRKDLKRAEETSETIRTRNRQTSVQLSLVTAIGKIASVQLSKPTLETERVRSALELLQPLLEGDPLDDYISLRIQDCLLLIRKLQNLLDCRRSGKKRDDDKAVRVFAHSVAEQCASSVRSLTEMMLARFMDMQRACLEKDVACLALEFFSSEEGLPVGIYTALMKAQEETMDQKVDSILKKLRDVSYLRDVQLD